MRCSTGPAVNTSYATGHVIYFFKFVLASIMLYNTVCALRFSLNCTVAHFHIFRLPGNEKKIAREKFEIRTIWESWAKSGSHRMVFAVPMVG